MFYNNEYSNVKLIIIKWINFNNHSLINGFLKSVPANTAFLPSSSSILNNWLYLANLSLLQGAPVLIYPEQSPTAISAINESSVSPKT